ncbi:dihydropteroate synthase [Riemerella anatipestifer]|uniref:Dihydropteroate synthase n=1 Tax=Riemerella anatipestifer TaxID=34085 RepID=A0AAP6LKB3_RIEAN|nr:dihydropteroate synthase [Riemerella anatipestifer]MCD5967889.1 dihydropteroate synthase [Riemerella anatipestifer]MCO7354324.1 dihydropteroate synthase [Riemerella anatipestifer]MCU7540003.1 dihydropteroate synthase [Riemerella anatipestifer]MCU7570211.1 dihydropteroate synthase [Riemerella anatipestifer]MCU7597299.1 dihydropteroate synthase [Riemerella anatipestifer]
MKTHSINCRGRLVDFSTPKIMGILNLTPDSFSDGGKFNTETSALIQTEKMLKEGASFIDLGAQSTRPNAQLVSVQEEIKRIGNLISLIKKEFPEALISLDTFYSEVMRFGYEEGIDLINDISGGQFDPKVWETVAQLKLPYVLMHINPEYQAMHEKIAYDDITKSINFYFSKKINQLKALGIHDVILDPGFGFGKTIEDQMTMIDEVEHIGFGKYPLLIGISRKSFIYKPLGKSPLEIDEETQQLHLKVLQQGASILRVHDVASAKRTLDQYLS